MSEILRRVSVLRVEEMGISRTRLVEILPQCSLAVADFLVTAMEKCEEQL